MAPVLKKPFLLSQTTSHLSFLLIFRVSILLLLFKFIWNHLLGGLLSKNAT